MTNQTDPLCIQVATTDHHYPIFIGSHLRNLTQYIQGHQVFLLCDKNTEHLLPAVTSLLAKHQVDIHLITANEQNKQLKQAEKLWQQLIVKQHHRDTTLIALGGGIVSDLGGFVASCYQRGIRYISIPTTLLAAVDASIGGKTAINFAGLKNMVGHFYPPQALFIEPDYFQSLPPRQWRSGMAEIIKAAAIASATFFHWLESEPLLQPDQPQSLPTLLKHAITIKQQIVEQDFHDQGLRQNLNFGHTLGHALESCLNEQLHHGEAVAIGMAFAAYLSTQACGLDKGVYHRLIQLLKRYQLPTQIPDTLSDDTLLNALSLDKKITKGRIKMILLPSLGQAERQLFDQGQIKIALNAYRKDAI